MTRKAYLDTKSFGRIVVVQNSQARRVIARWRAGVLHVTVPWYETADHIIQLLDRYHDRIMVLKHGEVEFHVGQVLQCLHCTITIGEQNQCPGKIFISSKDSDLKLEVYTGTDLSTIKESMTRAIGTLLRHKAPQVLLPYAQQVAHRVGVQPQGWNLTDGRKQLGRCSSSGIVTLSYYVMLLPEPLVGYVVCHELAHLTHFNHSAAFHQLCDSYLGGQEKALAKQLKEFAWPIVR